MCKARLLEERRRQIIETIRSRSPFTSEETEEIIRKYFSEVPTYVKILVTKYSFDEKRVLDVGCSYGHTLLYWGPGSEGVEVDGRAVSFLNALGVKVHALNIEDGLGELKPESYDAVFANDIIEHLVAPHLFLVRLHRLLKPHGLLALGHPIVPPWPMRRLWTMLGRRGWLGSEHINFYTAETSRLMLERAGFRVISKHASWLATRTPIVGRLLDSIMAGIGHHCLMVCIKVDSYKYPSKRRTIYDPSWAVEDLKHFR